ncbi:cytoplasmic heat shock protein 70 [Histomonas meleagridis]|uniref:cytoplasmic heat shock protein 70 n=1 Tax=Histomonas meleagridis TaxID=135588 RepID=UPI00355A95E5|nr:cytoplasmic heat shock protein 70 [Histomonas meleagridis]KAH0803665.1 cytoplasmic heat shock protein 70 [Histomonas meleagridis]
MKQLHMAAINKGDPSLTVKDILLFDVVPLSLGISIKDGMMTVLILRSTTIPAEKLNIITIFNYTIKVYEGERSRTCGLLGTFDLTGILPGPRFGVRNSLNKEHLANALSQADKDTINRKSMTHSHGSSCTKTQTSLHSKPSKRNSKVN